MNNINDENINNDNVQSAYLLYEIAHMYVDEGLSLRKIAQKVGVSHITVRENLLEKLPDYDMELYNQVLEKMKQNTPKSVKDPEVMKRVLLAYRLLIEKNDTVEEIANKLASTPFTIYRDLTNRLPKLSKIAPKTISPEMVRLVGQTLEQHRFANLYNYSREQTKSVSK